MKKLLVMLVMASFVAFGSVAYADAAPTKTNPDSTMAKKMTKKGTKKSSKKMMGKKSKKSSKKMTSKKSMSSNKNWSKSKKMGEKKQASAKKEKANPASKS